MAVIYLFSDHMEKNNTTTIKTWKIFNNKQCGYSINIDIVEDTNDPDDANSKSYLFKDCVYNTYKNESSEI